MNMSFNIDTSQLYVLEKSCMQNQANPFCPVLLRITNETLAKRYGGQYLIQVWNRQKELIFQRVRTQPITSWNLTGKYFVFKEDWSGFENGTLTQEVI